MFAAVSLDTRETGVKQVRNVLSDINRLQIYLIYCFHFSGKNLD